MKRLLNVIDDLPPKGVSKVAEEWLKGAHDTFVDYPIPNRDALKKVTERTHKGQRLSDVMDFKKLKRKRDEKFSKKQKKLRGDPDALAGDGMFVEYVLRFLNRF